MGQTTRHWYDTYSTHLIQRALWVPCTVPGISDGLSNYQFVPVNKMSQALLPGPEADQHHTAYVHVAKLSSSPEQGSCVWDLSDAKLLGVHLCCQPNNEDA